MKIILTFIFFIIAFSIQSQLVYKDTSGHPNNGITYRTIPYLDTVYTDYMNNKVNRDILRQSDSRRYKNYDSLLNFYTLETQRTLKIFLATRRNYQGLIDKLRKEMEAERKLLESDTIDIKN